MESEQLMTTTDDRPLVAMSGGDLAITEDGEPWAELRHGLYSLALTEFQIIREIYPAAT